MSASFPNSSSWEPYGSSQQQGLSWRPPATGPSKRQTPPLPLSFLRKPTQPSVPIPPSNPTTSAHERQLAEGERAARLETRFTSLEARLQALATQQNRVEAQLEKLANQSAHATRSLTESFVNVQHAVAGVTKDVRNFAEYARRDAREIRREIHADVLEFRNLVQGISANIPQLVTGAVKECVEPIVRRDDFRRIPLRLPLVQTGCTSASREATIRASLPGELDFFEEADGRLEDAGDTRSTSHSSSDSYTVSAFSDSSPGSEESAWRLDAVPYIRRSGRGRGRARGAEQMSLKRRRVRDMKRADVMEGSR